MSRVELRRLLPLFLAPCISLRAAGQNVPKPDSCAQVSEEHLANLDLPASTSPSPLVFGKMPDSPQSPNTETVELSLVVDATGRVDTARSKVRGDTDSHYVSSVRRHLLEWRFTPARVGGCSVPARFHMLMSMDPKPRRLPFSKRDDRDGARFVWYSFSQAGSAYSYVPAKEFPTTSQFVEVSSDSARPGDVAWWARFVAVYYGKTDRMVLVYPGIRVPLDTLSLKFGPPRFFRLALPTPPAH
jgi:hypothetical protein